jgi:Cu+-exporting ATPase
MASNQSSFLLAIHGMTCAGCVARVEKAIARIPHATIAVDLLQHQAQVSGISVDAAIAAIRAAGYEASLIPREPATSTNRSHLGQTSTPASLTVDSSSHTTVGLIIAGLALVLSFVDMGFMLAGRHWMPVTGAMGLASLALILYGSPMLPKALAAVRRGSANMQTLLLLGSGAAYAWSTGVWLEVWSGPVYFEATTVVLSMHHLGQWLEARARQRAIDALEPYLSSSAEQARRLDGPEGSNKLVMVPAHELHPGHQIRIESGEALVADGLVVEGEGLVDESLLTGESMPVQRHAGQLVYAGTRLLSGELTLRIQMSPGQWRRDVIGQQLQQALMSKAPIAAMADRLAARFVPFVVILAFVNALGQWWWGVEPAAIIERTIAILVVACPCALGLATPTAIAAGLAVAARHGWLFRNAGAIESLARTTHLALDKTGTLTMGRPKLLAIQSAHESARPIVQADFPSWLAMACRAEEGSQHPLAGALLSHVAGRPMPSLRSVETLAGRGLLAQTDDGRMVCIGSSSWIASVASNQRPREEPEQWGHASCIEVAQQNGDWFGRVWIGDALRPGAQHLVSTLKKMGLQVALISGDRPAAVEAAAQAVGIQPNLVYAQASPENKAQAFLEWRHNGGVVAMVGDGLNDSLALGQADVGIAMAAGASTAVQAADVTLTNSQDISQLLGVLKLARDIVSRVRQNLFFAFVFNISALPAAAFGWLSPALAGGAMAMSASLVVGHAVGLLRWKRSPASEPA